MKLNHWLAATVLAAAVGGAQAQALPIVGGVTAVTLTSAPTLSDVGLDVGILGTATFSPGSAGIPLVYFPVTGGAIDTATFAGSIEHDGSGLSLSTAAATVELTNFVIDTIGLQLSGNVAVDGSGLGVVPLFDLGFGTNPFSPVTLNLTSQAAGALTAVFGLPDLTGFEIGTANTIPVTVVPEPATYLSMLGGLALMGAFVARRRSAARREETAPAVA